MSEKREALERVREIGRNGVEAACAWFGRDAKDCMGCPAFECDLSCVACALFDAAGSLDRKEAVR